MKRFIGIILIIFVFNSFLIAKGNYDGCITLKKYDEDTNLLLESIMSENIFNFKIDFKQQPSKYILFWIAYYEKDKYVKKIFSRQLKLKKEIYSYFFFFYNIMLTEEDSLWFLNIFSPKYRFKDYILSNNSMITYEFSGKKTIINKKCFNLEEEINLGIIYHYKDTWDNPTGLHELTLDVSNIDKKDLVLFDRSFIIKCKFTNSTIESSFE